MDNCIISLIFDMKENEGYFKNSHSPEYKTFLKVQQDKSNLLNDFISKNIDAQLKEELNALIESYTDSISDTYYSEFKIYYKTGFKDGINLIAKQ